MEQSDAARAAAEYKLKCLDIYRRLRFDMQELDASPEIRTDAIAMEKAVAAGERETALELSRTIVYLVSMVRERRYVSDEDLENIRGAAEKLSCALGAAEG